MLDHSHLAIPLRGIGISWGFAPPSNLNIEPRSRLPAPLRNVTDSLLKPSLRSFSALTCP